MQTSSFYFRLLRKGENGAKGAKVERRWGMRIDEEGPVNSQLNRKVRVVDR